MLNTMPVVRKMMRRDVERLKDPWLAEDPDSRGFFIYLREHYEKALTFAVELANDHCGPDLPHQILVQMIFDKVASPLVYAYDKWRVLAPQVRARYSPELAKIHEESKRLAEEVFKK